MTHDDDTAADFIPRLLRHEPNVRGFLRSMLMGAEEVDEVMQRTSTVAWQKYRASQPIESFGTWLCVIARYEALRYARDAARRPAALSDAVLSLIADEGLDEVDDRQAELDALQHCLQKLPVVTRSAVMAVHRSGDSVKSVAQSMGASVAAVYKRVHRARLQLLRCIEQRLAVGGSI